MEPLELRFQAGPPGRWLVTTFLGVWLSLWVLVDLAVLAVLAAVLRSWLQEGRPGSIATLLPLLPLLTVLILWLSLWTGAGVLALRQWSRWISTQDVLKLSATRLEIRRGLAFLHRTQSLPRETIQTVLLAPGRDGKAGPLLAQLRSGPVELTQLGSPQQRQQAAELLQRALVHSSPSGAEPALAELPSAWECVETNFDTALLVPARRLGRRRALARLLLIVALDGGLLLLLLQTHSWLLLLPLLIAGVASWRTLGRALARQEWLLGQGQLTARQRFAGRVRPLYTIGRLELQEQLRADGSLRYSLLAGELGRLAGRRPPRALQVICSSPDDPGEPRMLGHWLASRTHIPFRDLVQAEH